MRINTNIQNLASYKIYLQVEAATHEFMMKKGYLRLDLPVMSPALIPESYLEIFETEFNFFKRKEKLYLTPSPELFMKRLLTNGIGNIYYLGKSFRNAEPNSSFHLPEFTMLEFYKVSMKYLELADEILELMRFINSKVKFKSEKSKILNSNLKFEKWEKYTVAEAFTKFADVSEKELFDKVRFIKKAKEKGYQTKGFSYQDVFSQMIAQEVEPKLGISGHPAMLYDYPREMSSLAKLSPDKKVAKRVEFYINGIEIGGCCEELNDWKEQETRYKIQETTRQKLGLISHQVDKGFIEALKYGLPDCTGAGIGFERLAMIFANVDSVDKIKLINIS